MGTWSVEIEETNWDENTGTNVTTYGKVVFTFKENEDFSLTVYTGTKPDDYGDPVEEGSGTYTYGDGTLTVTPSEGEPSSVKVKLYENVLIFGDETSASAYAYIKQ